MKNVRNLLLGAGSGLLVFSMAAPAQYPPRASERYDWNASGDRAHFFDRVQADLDRAESSASTTNGDLDRIATVRDEVGSLQRKLDAGNYDARELTESIVSLQRVLDHNPLYDSTRDRLISDLGRMRDMRARLEDVR